MGGKRERGRTVFIRCTMWTWLSISGRNFLPNVRSFAHSLVQYLLPWRRKMRASHLHVKSDKTSARFTAEVTRHFSHFATHPRYTIFWQKKNKKRGNTTPRADRLYSRRDIFKWVICKCAPFCSARARHQNVSQIRVFVSRFVAIHYETR